MTNTPEPSTPPATTTPGRPAGPDPHVETLHDNEWLSLRVVRKPEAGVNGYVYSHESRCQGRIVAVLPYRVVAGRVEYLVKSEMTPCWGFDQVLSAITGGYEGGDIEDDAVREMLEETGYTIARDELFPLGESFASKSADTVYSLFSVNLTDREQGEAIGDGSRVEAESAAVWLTGRELAEIRDPQVAVMHLRLSPRFDPHPDSDVDKLADMIGSSPETWKHITDRYPGLAHQIERVIDPNLRAAAAPEPASGEEAP